jgi:hypothetical protein
MPYRTKGRYRHPMERVKVSMFIPISSCCGYGARLKDGHGVKRRSPQDTDQSRPMRRIPRNPPETRQNFRRKAHTPSDLSLPHPLRGRAVWLSAALAVRGVDLTPSLARKSTFCLRGLPAFLRLVTTKCALVVDCRVTILQTNPTVIGPVTGQPAQAIRDHGLGLLSGLSDSTCWGRFSEPRR